MKHIVTMGGGTGQPAVLAGLKNLRAKRRDLSLTAVVTSADSGGSSEKLRCERRVLPPGDMIRCLLALGNADADVMGLVEHRPLGEGIMGGHRIGNILLTGSMERHPHDVARAIRTVGKITRSKGTVLPITDELVDLWARFENGVEVCGEDVIDKGTHAGTGRITAMWLKRRTENERNHDPTPESIPIPASSRALRAIGVADLIIAGPGALYTSVIPTVLFAEMQKALRDRRGTLVLVTNIMSKRAETFGFGATDFVAEFEKYAGCEVDVVVCNNESPEAAVLERYSREGAQFVELPAVGRLGRRLVIAMPLIAPLAHIDDVVRHDSARLAEVIATLL